MRVEFVLASFLVSLLFLGACDGGGGGGDDGVSDAPHVPEAPTDQPPTDDQLIHEPSVVDAPMGDPATAPSYSIVSLGLIDGEHATGRTDVRDLNEAGEVIGTTGSSAWVYMKGMNHELGWTDFTGGSPDAWRTWRSSDAVSANQHAVACQLCRLGI